MVPRGSVKLTPNVSSMMDPDYMAMMLAMDTLWASEDVQDTSPEAGDGLPSTDTT